MYFQAGSPEKVFDLVCSTLDQDNDNNSNQIFYITSLKTGKFLFDALSHEEMRVRIRKHVLFSTMYCCRTQHIGLGC
jgi:hypothetical protein